MTVVEWRVDDAGNVTLHLDGEKAPPPFVGADVRRVRTKRLQRAVLNALDEAARLGAAHGPCDRQAEMARSLRREPSAPGCASFWPSLDSMSVARRMDGAEVTVVEGIRPKYLSGDISNALDRAFKVGARYGYESEDRS